MALPKGTDFRKVKSKGPVRYRVVELECGATRKDLRGKGYEVEVTSIGRVLVARIAAEVMMDILENRSGEYDALVRQVEELRASLGYEAILWCPDYVQFAVLEEVTTNERKTGRARA